MILSSLYKVKVSTMIGCITFSSSNGQGYDIIFSCHYFKNHVMVCDPLGSVQGPTSLFFFKLWWRLTLSSQYKVQPHSFFTTWQFVTLTAQSKVLTSLLPFGT